MNFKILLIVISIEIFSFNSLLRASINTILKHDVIITSLNYC